MVDGSSTIAVNIYYKNAALEPLLEESRRSFPIAGVAVKLEQEHAAEMQTGSATDTGR